MIKKFHQHKNQIYGKITVSYYLCNIHLNLNFIFMITLKRIRKADEQILEKLTELYIISFPEEERRTIPQLKRMIEEVEEMNFCAIELDGNLSGLAVYWNMGEFFYMEHLAVFPEMRNHKIGQKVLEWWKQNLDKPQLLEVEPPTDEMTERRINFYRRNGMEILNKEYIQPSYKKDEDSLPLWIMGTENPEKLDEYIADIRRVAYKEALKFI